MKPLPIDPVQGVPTRTEESSEPVPVPPAGAGAPPIDTEAENMLRRVVAARDMAWLDDEIEGAARFLARRDAL